MTHKSILLLIYEAKRVHLNGHIDNIVEKYGKHDIPTFIYIITSIRNIFYIDEALSLIKSQ